MKSKRDKNVPENKEHFKGTDAAAIILWIRTGRSSQMGPRGKVKGGEVGDLEGARTSGYHRL